MKKSVRETLKLAVEQLFVRIHFNLIHDIYTSENNGAINQSVTFDDSNPAHLELVALCKQKIGYGKFATPQEMFLSIMSVYCSHQEKKDAATEVKEDVL